MLGSPLFCRTAPEMVPAINSKVTRQTAKDLRMVMLLSIAGLSLLVVILLITKEVDQALSTYAIAFQLEY